MTITPSRTDEERRAALDLGNRIRLQRAAFRGNLRAGTARLSDVVLEPPDWLVNAPVATMMLAVRGLGPVKVSGWLEDAGISPRRTFGGLTQRQRWALVGLLTGHESRRVA